MLRVLQIVNGKNVDAQYKAKVALVRGMFVNKKYDTKEVILPVTASIAEIYLVDRGLIAETAATAGGAIQTDYDTALETIAIGEFVNLIAMFAGERYATSAYSGEDADLVAGKYLMVSIAEDATQGKLVASTANAKSNFRSLGYYQDNANKLLSFEFVV